MKNNPRIHHRRSIQLKNYEYVRKIFRPYIARPGHTMS